jgi:hypothetical protein
MRTGPSVYHPDGWRWCRTPPGGALGVVLGSPGAPSSFAMTFDHFVTEVRSRLDLLGLPRNWQPSRSDLQPFHAQGVSA